MEGLRENGYPTSIGQKYSDLTLAKSFVREGFPRSERGKCWMEYSGASDMMTHDPELYSKLLEQEAHDWKHYTPLNNRVLQCVKEIERDVFRTFPDNFKFRHRKLASETDLPMPAHVSQTCRESQLLNLKEHSSDPGMDDQVRNNFELSGENSNEAIRKDSKKVSDEEINAFNFNLRSTIQANDDSGTDSDGSFSDRNDTSKTNSSWVLSFDKFGIFGKPSDTLLSKSSSSVSSVTNDNTSVKQVSATISPLIELRPTNGRHSTALKGKSHSDSDLATMRKSQALSSQQTMKSSMNISKRPVSDHNQPTLSAESNQYILSLRQILVCFAYFSWPHPDPSISFSRQCSYNIGYCQSLNFIVAMLLLVLVRADPATTLAFEKHDKSVIRKIERDVFWLLVALIDNILPDEMYGQNLEGVQIQQQILWGMIVQNRKYKYGFETLAKWCHKFTSGSSKEHEGLRMITTPWFLQLYLNVMPTETVLRIWDCMFYQKSGEKMVSVILKLAIQSCHDSVASKRTRNRRMH
jgi:Rab-GTPase-TBC domain